MQGGEKERCNVISDASGAKLDHKRLEKSKVYIVAQFQIATFLSPLEIEFTRKGNIPS